MWRQRYTDLTAVGVMLCLVLTVGIAFRTDLMVAYHDLALTRAENAYIRLRGSPGGWTSREEAARSIQHHWKALLRLGLLVREEVRVVNIKSDDQYVSVLLDLQKICNSRLGISINPQDQQLWTIECSPDDLSKLEEVIRTHDERASKVREER